MMLDQETRTIAERLRLDRIVEIIAKALPGFRAEIRGAGLGRAENSKLHFESLPVIGREYLSAIRCSRDRSRSTARSRDRAATHATASPTRPTAPGSTTPPPDPDFSR